MPIISTLPAYLSKKEKYIVFHNVKSSTALGFTHFIDQIRFKSISKVCYIITDKTSERFPQTH